MHGISVPILACLFAGVAFAALGPPPPAKPPAAKPPAFLGGGVAAGVGTVAGAAQGSSPFGNATAHVSGGTNATGGGGSSSWSGADLLNGTNAGNTSYASGTGSTWGDLSASGNNATGILETAAAGTGIGGANIHGVKPPRPGHG